MTGRAKMKQKKIDLSRIMRHVALVLAMMCFAANADTFYSVADATLNIAVPAGETNEVDAAQLSGLLDNTITDVRKSGEGCLVMNTDITAYAGNIHVDEGTWRVMDSNGLGKLSNSAMATDVGIVYVADGATLESCCSASPVYFGKQIHIAGYGVNGCGALLTNGKNNYGSSTWGSNLVLDGDAYASALTTHFWYMNRSPTYLTFNGHRLTVNGNIVVLSGVKTVDTGTIALTNKTVLSFQNENTFSQIDGDVGKIIVPEGCKLMGNRWRGRYEWELGWDSSVFNTPNVLYPFGDFVVTNKAAWHGPINLKKDMRISIPEGGGFSLMGPISGAYGIWFSNVSKDVVPTNNVYIGNSANSFSGTLRAEEVVLNILANGAVPSDCSGICVTNTSIRLSDTTYLLPSLDFACVPTCQIYGGYGKFASVAKRGKGTLDYVSAVGADVLDIHDGYVNLPGYSKYLPWKAGLVECVAYTNDSDVAYNYVKNGTPLPPVAIQLEPKAMYRDKSYPIRQRPAWDTKNEVTRHSIAYSGYIWNRTGKDVEWTFAGDVTTHLSLFIDGKRVLYVTNTREAGKATLTLSPGPHSIYIGNSAKIGDGGINASAENMVWNDAGIRYDPLGRNSDHMDDYIKLQDPGDGSLLTWGLPNVNETHPVTGAMTTPLSFGRLKFHLGADGQSSGVLDLDGGSLTVDAVEGFPRVANAETFTISSRWELDGNDIAAKGKSIGVPIRFGDDAELIINDFDDTLKRIRNVDSFVLAEAASPIPGSLSVKDSSVSAWWTVAIEEEKVVLNRRKHGLTVHVR